MVRLFELSKTEMRTFEKIFILVRKPFDAPHIQADHSKAIATWYKEWINVRVVPEEHQKASKNLFGVDPNDH